MIEPLRLGVLGAARIDDMTFFPPAEDIGARIVAVAARDRGRAEQYARVHRGVAHDGAHKLNTPTMIDRRDPSTERKKEKTDGRQ